MPGSVEEGVVRGCMQRGCMERWCKGCTGVQGGCGTLGGVWHVEDASITAAAAAAAVWCIVPPTEAAALAAHVPTWASSLASVKCVASLYMAFPAAAPAAAITMGPVPPACFAAKAEDIPHMAATCAGAVPWGGSRHRAMPAAMACSRMPPPLRSAFRRAASARCFCSASSSSSWGIGIELGG